MYKIRFDCYDQTAPEYAAWDGVFTAGVCFAEGEVMVRLERHGKCKHQWVQTEKSSTGCVTYITSWCRLCGTLREESIMFVGTKRDVKRTYRIPKRG